MHDARTKPYSFVMWRLIIHFSLLSILAAYVVGMGKRSMELPLLVIYAAVLALITSDWLGWLRINRTLSYLGMLVGAAVALYQYWSDLQSNSGITNLHAVAQMLVYIQLPLMFQQKDQRLFEHWGVFLLLEFVVAALLNDNILFGFLLIPSLLVGCSTLIALAVFISHEKSGIDQAYRRGLLSSIREKWRWKRTPSKALASIRMSATTAKETDSRTAWIVHGFQGLLMSNGIVLFAMVYFFCLPRLHTGAYEGLGASKSLVGFSGKILLKDVGELLTNDDLALRMSIRERNSNRPIPLVEPPYIRGTVADAYAVGSGNWFTSNSHLETISLLLANELRDEVSAGGGAHLVTIQEHTEVGEILFSVPPFFQGERPQGLRFNAESWCMRFPKPDQPSYRFARRRYQFATSAFQFTRQSPILFELSDCRATPSYRDDEPNQPTVPDLPPERFPGLLALRDQILSAVPDASVLEKILLLEDHLASSSDFHYSLLPHVNRANGIDPIEDFVANHRTGHCQYFASALAIMLRSMGLPSRIVLGFRPSEYNELGDYFVVRQRHAHAWVEVYLPPAILTDGTLNVPPWVHRGAWLRLDPTPTGDGSNAGGSLRNASRSNQAFEAMEQLWKDGFIDFDGSRQPEVVRLFGASGDGAVAAIFRYVERFALQMQSRTIGGEGWSIENWFSWRSGVFASALAVFALAGYRLIHRWPWGLSNHFIGRRRNSQRSEMRSTWNLYRRMNKALARLGRLRSENQTPHEFIEETQAWLGRTVPEGLSCTADLLPVVDAFYWLRYGPGRQFTPEELQSLESSVHWLEKIAFEKGRLFR